MAAVALNGIAEISWRFQTNAIKNWRFQTWNRQDFLVFDWDRQRMKEVIELRHLSYFLSDCWVTVALL